jgi:MFS family permease
MITAERLSPAAPAPQTEPATGFWSRLGPLRHKHFRRVWIGSFGSSVGGFMEHVGIAWIITTESKTPALALGYLAAAQLLPMMGLGIPAGLMADRVNRKKFLLITQALLCLVAASIAALSLLHLAVPSALIAMMALMGIVIAFNVPAWQVLTPRLVPREELTRAIFLNGLQFNLARIVGPGIGGLLLSWQGPSILFCINTLSFIGVLAAVWSTPDAPAPEKKPESAWHGIREAFDFAWHGKGPRAVFLAMIVFACFAVPLMRLMPMFVSEVYWTKDSPEDVQEIYYGILLAVMGAGAVIGVAILKLIPKWYPKHHFIPMSILGAGFFITAFGAISHLLLGSIALLLSGVFWLWGFSSGFAAIQLLVPDALRGRVMALLNVLTFGAMALGPILAGALGEAVAHVAGDDLQTASSDGIAAQVGVGATGAVLVLAGLAMLIWRTPEVDGLRPGDKGYDRRRSLIAGITGLAHRPSSPATSLDTTPATAPTENPAPSETSELL